VTEGKNRVMKTVYLVSIGMAGISAIAAVAAQRQMNSAASTNGLKAEAVVDATGNLHVPDDYRATYQFLGSWAVAAGEGQSPKELHVVYASPGTIAAYRESGGFPDGAVLVKEVFYTAAEPMTTGIVSHADKLKGWFVMVRDSGNHYVGKKLWGDGWGWSWFDATDPLKTTSTDYETNCLYCHIPAKSSAWIYVGGYPPLRR
jgi:Cytochrome P460